MTTKIIATHLILHTPDGKLLTRKVHELENGGYYQENYDGYFGHPIFEPISKEQFEAGVKALQEYDKFTTA